MARKEEISRNDLLGLGWCSERMCLKLLSSFSLPQIMTQ